VKKKFEKELIHLISAHRNGAKGLRTALALSERIDSIIIDTCQKFFFKEEYPLVVVALGSYGRKELCFKSDIDIMFLTETSDSQIQDIVKRVYQKLADLGVNIGHSFRTIDDCI